MECHHPRSDSTWLLQRSQVAAGAEDLMFPWCRSLGTCRSSAWHRSWKNQPVGRWRRGSLRHVSGGEASHVGPRQRGILALLQRLAMCSTICSP